jgi:hypothetical protein
MGNPVVHFEIGCRDSKKTEDFTPACLTGSLRQWAQP